MLVLGMILVDRFIVPLKMSFYPTTGRLAKGEGSGQKEERSMTCCIISVISRFVS